MALQRITIPDFNFTSFYYPDILNALLNWTRVNVPEITKESSYDIFIQALRAFSLVGHLNNCNIADRTPKLETKCGVEEEPGEIMEEEPNKVIYPQVIFYFFIGLLVIGIIIVLFILIFKGKGIVEKQ